MDSASYWECEKVLEEHWALEITLQTPLKTVICPREHLNIVCERRK